MRLLIFCWITHSSLAIFAQKKTDIKDFNDSLFQSFNKTILSDIDVSQKVQRPLIAVDSVSKNIGFIYISNSTNGAKSRVKSVVVNHKLELLFQKEASIATRKGTLDVTEVLDCGDDWAIFNTDDFFIEEFLISKKDGSVSKAKQYDPKLLAHRRVFKYQNKLYLFTFDSKNYILYQLEQGHIVSIGKDKLPEIPKFNLEKALEAAIYVRDYRLPKFSESAGNYKVFTIQNQLVFSFDIVTKTESQMLTLSFDLATGIASKVSRNYPSVASSLAMTLGVAKTKGYQFGSFISSDSKVFLSTINEKDFVISIQNLEGSNELRRITCSKKEGFGFRNSAIYNDQSNHNMWSGKQQRKALDTLGEAQFWEHIVKSGLTILAVPTEGGYNLTCGNYVYNTTDDGSVLAAGILFGAIGAGIAGGLAAENSGTDSQYFYAHLNTSLEPVKDIELPTHQTQQYKVFDYNPRFKYRTYFQIDGKNAFCIYHSDSKKLMLVSE